MNLIEEWWRPIYGYENAYEVSSFGRVRSLDREVFVERYGKQVIHKRLGKVLKPRIVKGYEMLALHSDGAAKYVSVHSLVATAFLGDHPSDRNQVAHWDGDRRNNCYRNLRWATAKENDADKIRHGTYGAGGKARRVVTDEDVLAISIDESRQVDIAKRYGISQTHVSNIKRGVRRAMR